MTEIVDPIALSLVAAGFSLTYLRMGGNVFGAVIIFIMARMFSA